MNSKEVAYLDELLTPQKGNFNYRNISDIEAIEKRVQAIRGFLDVYYSTNSCSTIIKIPTDVLSARIGLIEIVEITDINSKESEKAYLFNKHLKKRLYIANGATSANFFTVKKYKKLFETFSNSFYFITNLAIYASYCTDRCRKNSEIHNNLTYLQTPIDWIVALFNCLCYHKKAFIRSFRCTNEEIDKLLALIGCVCSIIKFLIQELKECDEYIRSAQKRKKTST